MPWGGTTPGGLGWGRAGESSGGSSRGRPSSAGPGALHLTATQIRGSGSLSCAGTAVKQAPAILQIKVETNGVKSQQAPANGYRPGTVSLPAAEGPSPRGKTAPGHPSHTLSQSHHWEESVAKTGAALERLVPSSRASSGSQKLNTHNFQLDSPAANGLRNETGARWHPLHRLPGSPEWGSLPVTIHGAAGAKRPTSLGKAGQQAKLRTITVSPALLGTQHAGRNFSMQRARLEKGGEGRGNLRPGSLDSRHAASLPSKSVWTRASGQDYSGCGKPETWCGSRTIPDTENDRPSTAKNHRSPSSPETPARLPSEGPRLLELQYPEGWNREHGGGDNDPAVASRNVCEGTGRTTSPTPRAAPGSSEKGQPSSSPPSRLSMRYTRSKAHSQGLLHLFFRGAILFNYRS
jgi:hypothetical protein